MLASSGDEALVENRRGERYWMRTCDLVSRRGAWYDVLPRRRRGTVDALAAAKLARDSFRAAIDVKADRGAPRVVTPLFDGVWLFEGALSREDLADIHSCAVSCLQEAWGTVRRRTVGGPTDTMTHVRLTSQFANRTPRALRTLQELVLSTGQCLAVKQCDYLVYGESDSAGWHDHAGESTMFLVALLFNEDCQGGEFLVRDASHQREMKLLRTAGDVVLCRSHVDHMVSPIRSGTRISINLDFWETLKGSHDRRSPHDLV